MGQRTTVLGSTVTTMFRCLSFSLPHQPFLMVTRTGVELKHGVSADREGAWSQHVTVAVACNQPAEQLEFYSCFWTNVSWGQKVSPKWLATLRTHESGVSHVHDCPEYQVFWPSHSFPSVHVCSTLFL